MSINTDFYNRCERHTKTITDPYIDTNSYIRAYKHTTHYTHTHTKPHVAGTSTNLKRLKRRKKSRNYRLSCAWIKTKIICIFCACMHLHATLSLHWYVYACVVTGKRAACDRGQPRQEEASKKTQGVFFFFFFPFSPFFARVLFVCLSTEMVAFAYEHSLSLLQVTKSCIVSGF